MPNLDSKAYDQLIDLCVNIEAHSALDMEVTIGGNGTNCSEAMNVAVAIKRIINPDKVTYSKLVADYKAELKKEYGFNEEDEDESSEDE